jgi:hypothetical protein
MSEFERMTAFKSSIKAINEAEYTVVQGQADYLLIKNLKVGR